MQLFLKKFDGKAYPVSRIFLSWSEQENSTFIPTVITQIEYINTGAQIGKIDNVMLELTINGGNVHAFQAILVTENIDLVLDDGDILRDSPNVTQFTTVWINPRTSKQQSVIFQPSGSFTLEKPSTLKIKLSYYSVDNLSWHINRNKTPKIEWKPV